MLKIALLAVVAVAVSAQWNILVDTIHGYRVEYDDSHDILMMISDRDCYIVEASDANWDALIRDKPRMEETSEALYAQVQSGSGVTSMTHQEAADAYHSRLESWQCRRKDVHKIAYTPSGDGN